MNLADTIRDFNETQGGEKPSQSAPVQTSTETPAAPPTTQTAPPTKTPEKAPETPITPADQPPIKDPSFVKQPKEKQPAPAAGTPPSTPGAPPAKETGPDIFSTRLSELTAGKMKTDKDLKELIDRHTLLSQEAEKGFQPKFKDERAKMVHQLITENPGKESQVLIRALRALDFKPEGKSQKEILFQSYLLDPKNSDLTERAAEELFEAMYEEKYKDIDTSPLKKRELELESRAAMESITRLQGEFSAPDVRAADLDQKTIKSVTDAVQGFGGLKLAFSDNPQETEFLNIAMDDPAEVQAIQNELLNPAQAYAELLGKYNFETKQGYADIVRETYMRRNVEKIVQEAFKHGGTLERVKMVNEMRNASGPMDVSKVGGPAPAGKTTFFGAWENAVNKKAS